MSCCTPHHGPDLDSVNLTATTTKNLRDDIVQQQRGIQFREEHRIRQNRNEDDAQYIRTDYIPGQDVDMNDEFLRTLLNSIVTSFGLDSAVIDATNGNARSQFLRYCTEE